MEQLLSLSKSLQSAAMHLRDTILFVAFVTLRQRSIASGEVKAQHKMRFVSECEEYIYLSSIVCRSM